MIVFSPGRTLEPVFKRRSRRTTDGEDSWLLWQGQSDAFLFTLSDEEEVSSKVIFDPMGFLACVTIIPKIILQDIWRLGRDGRPGEKADWDDELPKCIKDRWRAFTKNLKRLGDCECSAVCGQKISDRKKPNSSCTHSQMHQNEPMRRWFTYDRCVEKRFM